QALQFQLPAAIIAELIQLARMGKRKRNQHINGNDQPADPGVYAHNDKKRCDDFADIDPPSEKRGQAVGGKHGFYSADPVFELGDAMEQNENANGQTQDKLAEI